MMEMTNIINVKKVMSLSYAKKSFVLFENCYRLEDGNDEKCESCISIYQPNFEGGYVKTFCDFYTKDVCDFCIERYYLKENTCKKIAIPNCL